jgi:hypothetical protein
VLSFRTVPTEHILSLLISERDKLSRAIEALGAPVKRRGRPPKGTPVRTASVAQPPKRRTFTPAQRNQQAERMKAFWAAKRREVSTQMKASWVARQKAAGKTATVAATKAAIVAPAKRKPMSAGQKRALSVKMKASWAKRKAAK